jgi:hypothetical protein
MFSASCYRGSTTVIRPTDRSVHNLCAKAPGQRAMQMSFPTSRTFAHARFLGPWSFRRTESKLSVSSPCAWTRSSMPREHPATQLAAIDRIAGERTRQSVARTRAARPAPAGHICPPIPCLPAPPPLQTPFVSQHPCPYHLKPHHPNKFHPTRLTPAHPKYCVAHLHKGARMVVVQQVPQVRPPESARCSRGE